MQNLRASFAPGAEPAAAAVELEETRQRLLNEATALAAAQCRMEAVQHEYNTAHSLTPAPDGPSQLGQVQHQGRAVGQMLGTDRPTYSSPVMNMRAAEAAIVELVHLEGKEL